MRSASASGSGSCRCGAYRVEVTQTSGPRHSGTVCQSARLVAVGDQRQVEFARLDPVHQFGRRRADHVHLHRRMRLGKALQDRRQIGERVVVRRCPAAPCRRSAAPGTWSAPRRSAPGSAARGSADTGHAASVPRCRPCRGSAPAGPSASSSRFTCMETADCVRPTLAAAWVKLWPSAISTKARSRSVSRACGQRHGHQAIFIAPIRAIRFTDSLGRRSMSPGQPGGHDVQSSALLRTPPDCGRRRCSPPPRLSSWARIRAAWRRYRSRQRIAQLDGHMLKDIGVSFAEAEAEANKPFWRA